MDKELKKNASEHMKKAIEHLQTELTHIRTGRASAALLDTIKVDYFGTPTPIKHVATVSVPDAKTIVVQPFQPNLIQAIDKAIRQSDLGLNPNSDGHSLKIPVPQLTEERRKDIMKVVKKLGEDTRVAIRNIRRDVVEKLRVLEKDGKLPEDDRHKSEKEVQDTTDQFIKEVDNVIIAKEKEVMTI